MLKLMKTIFLVERKNLKFKSIFSVLLLLIIGSFIYLENSQFRELEPGIASEVVAKNAALSLYRNADATDPEDSSPIFGNLNQQFDKLAYQSLGLIMDDESNYIKNAIELTDLRNEIYTMDGFSDVAEFMPTYSQNNLDYALYTAIQDQDEALLIDNSNFPTYIILLLIVLGYSWYLLVAVFSSDILLDEENHTSLVSGYPFTMAAKLLAKVFSYLIFTVGLLLFTFAIAIAAGAVMYEIDLTYPVALFNGEYFTVAIWEYIGMAFLYFACISLAALTVSIVLNYYLKNLYTVIFTHFFFFFSMQLIPVSGEWLWFLPFNYLNFSTLINGQSAEMIGSSMITLNNGFIILIVTTFILFLFIYWRFYLSQTRHSKKLDREVGIHDELY